MASANEEIKELLDRIELNCTCGACPEQYDAFLDGNQIGYLRLRHGYFEVNYLSPHGESVYEARPSGDGVFDSDERDRYLEAAKAALAARHLGISFDPNADAGSSTLTFR